MIDRLEYGEKLFARVDSIERHRTAGHIMPILWKLALRQNLAGQTELARLLTFFEPDELPKSRILAAHWLRRAAARCHATALHNIAVTHRNSGAMGKYRYWLARAARIDPADREELKQFRIRFPHTIMRRRHRYARER